MNSAEAITFAENYRLLKNEHMAIYELYARTYGLSAQEVGVLTALWLRHPGPCAQSDIQLKLCAPKQRVSAIIKKFRKLGYVSLTPSSTDGRNQLVQLSSNGEEYARTVVQPIIDAERQTASALSSDTAQTLLKSTLEMNRLLGNRLTPEEDTYARLRGFI